MENIFYSHLKTVVFLQFLYFKLYKEFLRAQGRKHFKFLFIYCT